MNRPLTAKYRRYAAGGNYAGLNAGLGIAQTGIGIADAASTNIDEQGLQKPSLGMDTAKGAIAGAAAGSVVPGIGTAIGAVVGGAAGFIGGKINQKKYEAQHGQYLLRQKQDIYNRGQAVIAADPTAVSGNLSASYFAAGGPLNVSNQQMENGSATPLSSTAAEFNGPSHEGGGIQLPNAGAEVEGKETTDGDYVFSSRLGFAQAHKPLARAIGKIEEKALSPERVNSLKLLREKVSMLKMSQEYLKSQLQPH